MLCLYLAPGTQLPAWKVICTVLQINQHRPWSVWKFSIYIHNLKSPDHSYMHFRTAREVLDRLETIVFWNAAAHCFIPFTAGLVTNVRIDFWGTVTWAGADRATGLDIKTENICAYFPVKIWNINALVLQVSKEDDNIFCVLSHQYVTHVQICFNCIFQYLIN